MTTPTITLGTRPSRLAQQMAEAVKARLLALHPALAAPGRVVIKLISTSGEWQPGQPEAGFAARGGTKGWFAKELQQALLAGEIDIAVHSLKDLENFSPPGLTLAGYLPRLDPRDAFLSSLAPDLLSLPAGATVGTASVRRQAQILARRQDLRVVPLRGNVDTRLQKLASGQVQAAIMACAGLERLGQASAITSAIPIDIMLPAVGQGVVALEVREADAASSALAASLNDPDTALCMQAERQLLLALEGSCQTPIGGLAMLNRNQTITLTGLLANLDGSQHVRLSATAASSDAAALGQELGQQLRAAAPWWPAA